jgi:hypothetical protein
LFPSASRPPSANRSSGSRIALSRSVSRHRRARRVILRASASAGSRSADLILILSMMAVAPRRSGDDRTARAPVSQFSQISHFSDDIRLPHCTPPNSIRPVVWVVRGAQCCKRKSFRIQMCRRRCINIAFGPVMLKN